MNSFNLAQTIKLQQTASDPNNSAWVFASAGSGKTKILTDRVLRLLLADVAPNKILCLTFTKVAAAEMQSRINSELARWIIFSDDELNKKLTDLSGKFPTQSEIKKARTLFIKILDSEARIKVQTIHSFCQTLIKIFPFEAKVVPNFDLLEGNREKLFLKKAQKEVLQKALKGNEVKELVKNISVRLHEEGLSELIANLLNKKEQLQSLRDEFFGIENVVEKIFQKLALSEGQTEKEIFADFSAKIDRDKNSLLAQILESTTSKQNAESGIRIKKFLDNPTLDEFETYKLAFFTQENAARKFYGSAAKDDFVIDFSEQARSLISDFDETLNSLRIAKSTASLLRLADHILENYTQLKKQNSVLDYGDLILESNRLLANPDFSDWVKMKMDGSFDHILIDESQDTNHQQWNIIKSLSEDFFSGLSATSKNRSIFIVGDEKQSIYSFQGAEPNISSEIFSFFEERLGGQLKKIELNNSFRSASKILQAVDEVFSDPQRKLAISKISESVSHKPIRDLIGKVEIWPQIQKEKEEKKEISYEWKLDFTEKKSVGEEEIVAKIIAQKIKSRVLSGEAKYADFMILLRNRTNGFDRALSKFFNLYKIPFTAASHVKFSDSLLICDLLAAARFALLPQDDLNAACLLKSPIFEVSEEDLLEICLEKNSEESSIYKALEGMSKFSYLKEGLDEIIAKSRELNCFEFFYFLLNEKNHQRDFVAHFGHESLEMLDKFTLTVLDFCQNFSPSLQKFLEFVEDLDPQVSLSCDEDNRVRISTIHSAKGLQSRIVMLPDCCYHFARLPSAKEKISWVEFDKTKFPIWCGSKSEENSVIKKHQQQKFQEAKEEYLRLLYVAMTRAEDELYIGGFGSSKDADSWYEIIRNSLSCAEFVSKEDFLQEVEIVVEKALSEQNNQTKSFAEESFKMPRSVAISASKGISPSSIKGRLIHKILEVIGKNHQAQKGWLLDLSRNIAARDEFLKEEEKAEIVEKIGEFLDSDQFEKLFLGRIRCESEIVGEVANQKILARIDLLIERENEVLIIDYKSDQALPESIPHHYQAQLETYQKLVANIYPNRPIRTGIFWTNFLKLMLN